MAEWSPEANDIFLQALEITAPEERRAFLDSACGGDDALRERVEGLLRASERAGSFLEAPAPDLATTAHAGAVPGGAVGPYKLLAEIGEGGMGVVWMAEQTEPVRRRVALKVIKPGMGSEQVVARFEAERQALALMDHPHIAKVLDGGATEEGRPYFVMELVKGVPITRYCDEQRLTPRERLGLFIPVCRAVQHAHQKGVIHRDLKPGNVLVALYDGRPVPKVIDFGVAKATEQRLTERTLFTAFGAVVGTPEYMSPEQAGLNQLDIDTRSDVYALGVLLYELLTGTTPLEHRRVKGADLLEVLRLVREEEPARPSARLSATAELPAIAARRGVEPKKLSGLVRGELDWVVMKALEKDRARRYETADALAQDLLRYLADEPVQACPPGAGYRLRKFVRRNRGPVLASLAIALLLVGGIVGTTWGLLRAVAERDQKDKARRTAEANEAQALAERRQAEAVASLLESIFHDKLSPQATSGDPLSELAWRVDKGVAGLEKEYAGQPLVRARLRNALGLTLLGLGEFERAADQFRQAVEERRAGLGPDHLDTVEAESHLAETYRWLGKPEQALPLARRVLAVRTEKLGRDHFDTLVSLNDLAWASWDAGDLEAGPPLLEEALARMKAKFGPGALSTLNIMSNLGQMYARSGQPEQAVALHREALDKTAAQLGHDHALTLRYLSDLAYAVREAGRPGEALPLFERALEGRKAKFGADHLQTLLSMEGAAETLVRTRQFGRGLALQQQVLDRLRARYGPDDRAALLSLGRLAIGYLRAGRAAQAVPLFEEELGRQKARFAPDHPDVLATQLNLGVAYGDVGRNQDAVTVLREARGKTQAKLGPVYPQTVVVTINLAKAYLTLGEPKQALTVLGPTVEALRVRRGPDHRDTLSCLPTLAAAYFNSGERDKARALLEEALPKLRAVLGSDDRQTLWAMYTLGAMYVHRGERDRAVPLYAQALERERAVLGPGHKDTLITLHALAVAYRDMGRPADALPLFEEEQKHAEAHQGPYDPKALQPLVEMAFLYEALGKPGQAAAVWGRVLAGCRKNWPGKRAVAEALTRVARDLLLQDKYAEAEPLLREALPIFAAHKPDEWQRFHALSLLGGALLGQKKYAEAEPLLREGCAGLTARAGSVPAKERGWVADALERLVKCYEAAGQPEKAAEWRKQLGARRQAGKGADRPQKK
jgi:serine/threonine protein kinase/tetratricopeptide (TPR) repeat protein